MIELKNINKHFNKGKQNEIHVINNTSLKFDNKGLVTILGSSGSGKTTLLNVIGGLDKAYGTIKIEDEVLTKYNSNVLDKIRNEKIGYIFQNYHLIETLTVFDNVKLSLTMIGLTNKEEIDQRVNYVLDILGMYRFKNKLASDLSGGQKQRVSIARALVKDPDVIIADEPTGNLDTNNSVEILKIIKEISKEKLVILVTHNINLANNFSDRIINIKDGSVIDDNKNHIASDDLDYIDENIYLKDLNKTNTENINIYSNEDINNLKLTIIKINNNYYLKSNDENITIENLNNSNKNIVDAHKTDFKESNFKSNLNFKIENIKIEDQIKESKSVYSFKDSFIMALSKFVNIGRKAKFQIFTLILLSIMFTISAISLLSLVFVDTSKVYENKNLYDVSREFTDFDMFLDDDYYLFIPNKRIHLSVSGQTTYLDLEYAPVSLISDINLESSEFIIDENILSDDYNYKHVLDGYSIKNKEDLIKANFTIVSYSNFGNNLNINLKGIDTINKDTMKIYLSDILINNILLEEVSDVFKVKEMYALNIIEETNQSDDNKIGVYVPDRYIENEDSEIFSQMSGYGLKIDEHYVKGYYEDTLSYSQNIYINSVDAKKQSINFMKDREYNSYSLSVFSKSNKDISSDYIINAYDSHLEFMKTELNLALVSTITPLVFIMTLSVLIFYFLVRSSLTKRRKEISVYRSLGLKKREVRKLFAMEYAIMTTVTSLIGVLIGSYLSYTISKSVIADFFTIRVNVFFILIIIITTYILNIFISLIPVNNLLRKTPAEMLTNYDI